MTGLSIAFVLLCTTWIVFGLGALWWVRSRPRACLDRQLRAVSVLKPLCGADPQLETNLESFFQQRYPSYQLVFGVQDPVDPAIPVVKRLLERYPDVDAALVIHSGTNSINPKVDNLMGMVETARHDCLLVSDSNILVQPDYLASTVAELDQEGLSLVTNLFVGRGEDTLGSILENVRLNGFCAAGAALPTLLGEALVIGKSMLFSRRVFETLGGFERVRNVIAEDFVMAKMYAHAGYEVRIATSFIDNITGRASVKQFLDRQLRWAMLRSRLRPLAQFAEVITSPLALMPFAWVLLGPYAALWTLGLLWLRDAGGWLTLRGTKGLVLPLLLAPLCEALMLMVWLRAPLKRHLSWRGHRVRLGAGTLAYSRMVT